MFALSDSQLKSLKKGVEDIVIRAYSKGIAEAEMRQNVADGMPVFDVSRLIDDIIVELCMFTEDFLGKEQE